MQLNSPSLYIEINQSNFIFVVGERDKKNNFKNIYKLEVSIKGSMKIEFQITMRF